MQKNNLNEFYGIIPQLQGKREPAPDKKTGKVKIDLRQVIYFISF